MSLAAHLTMYDLHELVCLRGQEEALAEKVAARAQVHLAFALASIDRSVDEIEFGKWSTVRDESLVVISNRWTTCSATRCAALMRAEKARSPDRDERAAMRMLMVSVLPAVDALGLLA